MKYFILLFLVTVFFSQNLVKGKIINTKNEPLAYASIEKLNSNTGTFSNLNGIFSIPITKNNELIKVYYVGYTPKEVLLNINDTSIIITLEPSVFTGEEVEVLGFSLNRFISNVLEEYENRREYLQQFSCDIYSKTKFLSAKQSIFGMQESISKLSYSSPDKYVEEVEELETSANIKHIPFDILKVQSRANVFNRSMKVFNLSIIHPLDQDALDYYDYELIKKKTVLSDTLFVIQCKPKLQRIPLLEGRLHILKNKKQLVKFDLFGNEATHTVDRQSLRIIQIYKPIQKDVYLPSFTHIKSRRSFLGFDYYFSQEYTNVNYKINGDVEIGSNLEINKKNLFKIQMTEREEKFKKKIHQIFDNAPWYRKILSSLLLDSPPLIFDRPIKVFNTKINKFSNWYHFNKASGHYFGYEYQIKNINRVNTYGNVGYYNGINAFGFNLSVHYLNTQLELSQEVEILGNIPIIKSLQTLSSLFYHKDVFNYYFSKEIVLSHQVDFGQKVTVILKAGGEYQTPIKNSTEFSFFNKDKFYTPNYEIKRYDKNYVSLRLNYLENVAKKRYESDSYFNSSLVYYTSFNKDKWNTNNSDFKKLTFNFDYHQTLFYPYSIDVSFLYNKQNKNRFAQNLNYVRENTPFIKSNFLLGFYSLKNYQYALSTYFSLKAELFLFRFPKFIKMKPQFSLFIHYLKPLENNLIDSFNIVKKPYYEYGIGINELSFLNLYLISSSLDKKTIQFRIEFKLD